MRFKGFNDKILFALFLLGLGIAYIMLINGRYFFVPYVALVVGSYIIKP